MIDNINIPNPFGGHEVNHPKRVIIHAMGEFIIINGKWYHAAEFLLKIGLSAHSLVTPSGVGIRCRQDNERASHAYKHNTDTLGIEFLVPGVFTKIQQLLDLMKTDYVTNAAYEKGLQIVNYWNQIHPIQEVTTHAAVSPKRKEDPGSGFPLDFYTEVNNSL